MKKVNTSSNLGANDGEVPKQKERHIVSWSQEEDDILRDQIRLHGTENWAIIASKFKDKTTRQCRRRWFTYLNSDFKKGGWSPEEDMLLCEAQKIYGNRWTEIAKVVSGRTDNAVKNRFTTLCKKRAKREALAKENNAFSYTYLNNKRVIFRNVLAADGGSESVVPRKKTRSYISSIENRDQGEQFTGVADNLRHPFAVISQSDQSCEDNNMERTFIKKDDPKVLALMQQAELLSSLAVKVNTEKTDQSLENAWMVLQDFLEQNKESELHTIRNLDTDSQVEKFKELAEELRRCNEPDVCDSSPASSEYSTGSTLLSTVPHVEKEECEAEISVLHQETGHVLDSEKLESQNFLAKRSAICHTESRNEVKIILTCDDVKPGDGGECEHTNTEFRSPVRVTPLFRALAAAIPSPKFSESEKHFLMKTLGMESTSPSSVVHSSRTPSCKRSLLHCL